MKFIQILMWFTKKKTASRGTNICHKCNILLCIINIIIFLIKIQVQQNYKKNDHHQHRWLELQFEFPKITSNPAPIHTKYCIEEIQRKKTRRRFKQQHKQLLPLSANSGSNHYIRWWWWLIINIERVGGGKKGCPNTRAIIWVLESDARWNLVSK